MKGYEIGFFPMAPACTRQWKEGTDTTNSWRNPYSWYLCPILSLSVLCFPFGLSYFLQLVCFWLRKFFLLPFLIDWGIDQQSEECTLHTNSKTGNLFTCIRNTVDLSRYRKIMSRSCKPSMGKKKQISKPASSKAKKTQETVKGSDDYEEGSHGSSLVEHILKLGGNKASTPLFRSLI